MLRAYTHFTLRPLTGALGAPIDGLTTIHRGIADCYAERRVMHLAAIAGPDRPH